MSAAIELKRQALQTAEGLLYDQFEQSMASFFVGAWSTLEPGAPLKFNWHHELVAEYLTAAFQRKIKRLIINMPPRYSKSLLCTVAFPCWAWIHNPSLRFMFTSYSGALSVKHSVNRRFLLESPFYQYAWGNKFQLTGDQNQKSQFENTMRGSMMSTSMSGTATGLGGNFLIVDDPHDTSRADSDTKRQSDIENFDQKFVTRLDDKENDVIVVVMQRLHEEDLTGHLIAKGGWEQVSIPVIAPEKKTYIFPVTEKKKTMNQGDVLHPEREGAKVLDELKVAMGSFGFSGQYLQDPSPREGGILKKNYWRYYKEAPDKFDEVIQSWDLTFKDTEHADYVVGQVWGRKGGNKYLLDQRREQLNFPRTKRAIVEMTLKWPDAMTILIEDKANGPAIISELKSHISGILEVDPGSKNKIERAAAIEPQLESGSVYLPDPSIATWVDDFVSRCAKFPRVKNDDEIDAMTQALSYLKGGETSALEALLNM